MPRDGAIVPSRASPDGIPRHQLGNLRAGKLAAFEERRGHALDLIPMCPKHRFDLFTEPADLLARLAERHAVDDQPGRLALYPEHVRLPLAGVDS